MYLAKSASLRSSDLSRQVGAAIFGESGEVITLGCNEVPKAGGGTYWTGDANDGRDMAIGHDSNERSKREILVDLLNRLKAGGHLSSELSAMISAKDVAEYLMQDISDSSVSDSRVMDLLEFGRIIHAEMSAICDAARKGVSVNAATLYCTTFPCHICAKHIVAAGISAVVYIEPYTKSYASDLHRDSISVESEIGKVQFRPFLGVSPFRYRDLFEKGKRKYSGGLVQRWNKDTKRPMIDVYYPSYFLAETFAVGRLKERVEHLVESNVLAERPLIGPETGS
jgi:cytidine deaminase